MRGCAWDPLPWNGGTERKQSCKEALTRRGGPHRTLGWRPFRAERNPARQTLRSYSHVDQPPAAAGGEVTVQTGSFDPMKKTDS